MLEILEVSVLIGTLLATAIYVAHEGLTDVTILKKNVKIYITDS